MQTVLLVIHLLIAVALVGSVLLQKSEGGALGMGGGGMSGFMTGRSTANLLTRTTAILAALFFATSVVLVLLASHRGTTRSLIDEPATSSPAAPVPALPTPGEPANPASSAPAAPAAPAEPSAPAAK
jgi:preprotein translocase subunit SecG